MWAETLIAGVELGGTKAVAVLARGSSIIDRVQVPTAAPAETLEAIRCQLAKWRANERFAALGIASFGPLRVRQDATGHGWMLATPKPGWSGVDIGRSLAGQLDCPWRLDTDVNAAALAEWRWGAAQGLDSVCYLTLGTGVGGGLLLGGTPVHGALHPEIGHLRLRRMSGDTFAGICPFHGDCIEGLISGPALRERFAQAPEQVLDEDPRWAWVVHDLAELIGTIALTTSPEKVLVGGGIGTSRPFLTHLVQERLVEVLSGYLPHLFGAGSDTFVQTPALGNDAGPLGAIAIGALAWTDNEKAGL